VGSVGSLVPSPPSVSNNGESMIGKDSPSLIKRHDKSGRTHGVPGSAEYCDTSVNTHMTCGNATMPLAVLDQVYGSGLCPASLMSIRAGNSRTYACDMRDMPGHESLSSSAHQLPRKSGPHDSGSWEKCLRASGQAVPDNKRRLSGDADKDGGNKRKKPKAKKDKKEKKD
jgi:hypothetical protein